MHNKERCAGMEEHSAGHTGVEEPSKEIAAIRVDHDKANLFADDEFLQCQREIARI